MGLACWLGPWLTRGSHCDSDLSLCASAVFVFDEALPDEADDDEPLVGVEVGELTGVMTLAEVADADKLADEVGEEEEELEEDFLKRFMRIADEPGPCVSWALVAESSRRCLCWRPPLSAGTS